jgi:dTDP-4-amino-4,6-dideoxygalactose transaminase
MISEKYRQYFEKINIKFFNEPINAKSNYWLNCILFEDQADQDGFLRFSNKIGIMTIPPWRLMDSLPMYKNCQKDNLKNSIELSERLVNIPNSVVVNNIGNNQIVFGIPEKAKE